MGDRCFVTAVVTWDGEAGTIWELPGIDSVTRTSRQRKAIPRDHRWVQVCERTHVRVCAGVCVILHMILHQQTPSMCVVSCILC